MFDFIGDTFSEYENSLTIESDRLERRYSRARADWQRALRAKEAGSRADFQAARLAALESAALAHAEAVAYYGAALYYAEQAEASFKAREEIAPRLEKYVAKRDAERHKSNARSARRMRLHALIKSEEYHKAADKVRAQIDERESQDHE